MDEVLHDNGNFIKSAWIDRDKKIVSFHAIPGWEIYTAPEKDFWKMITFMMSNGYRAQ